MGVVVHAPDAWKVSELLSACCASIGLGIAYSVHATHRFIDEFNAGADAHEVMLIALTGTGGALLGSMLTTSLGTGALSLAITPVLGDFRLLMALSVLCSFIYNNRAAARNPIVGAMR